MKSLDEAKSPGLRFDSHQDALDFVDKSVKNTKHWLAMQNLGTVESYVEAKTELVLRISIGPEKFDLVFVAIPKEILRSFNGSPIVTDLEIDIRDADRREDRMRIPIAYFVQSPKKLIPVSVWVEPKKTRRNLLRKVFTSSGTDAAEISRTSGKGKVIVSGVSHTRTDRYGVADVIECCSKTVDNIACDQGERNRDWPIESSLVNVVSGLRIGFDDFFVRVFVEKRSDLRFKIVDVLLCPLDLVP